MYWEWEYWEVVAWVIIGLMIAGTVAGYLIAKFGPKDKAELAEDAPESTSVV